MGVKKEQCCKAVKQTYMLENYHSLPHIVLFFLTQQGVTHQIHKITVKREAVTFVKVDQRRSEV